MGPFNGPTIAILVILAILLFGAKKLPDLARSLGRSARILKAESKGLVDEENKESEGQQGEQAQQNQQQPQQQAQQNPAPQQNQQQPQQQGYPQLPPGQRIVNESGEPTNQTYNN
ncbi:MULTISPECIES: Sec-independent protein translocase subunit TatA [unclassified Nocardiopsis]|uniref:Sec-independent protein translocase subunit TatA n=1 Tax=unclassified Nocardiopsis TaxID=2649073 RepID=UPI00066AE891|nr:MULTISPECIES: Sec-independent protein translocase subunit TatA [unclassified Nocardiopsis]MBQ1080904.1 Sec-independent protein translocase subunit TatA [Nocardiopsis sp. B62]